MKKWLLQIIPLVVTSFIYLFIKEHWNLSISEQRIVFYSCLFSGVIIGHWLRRKYA